MYKSDKILSIILFKINIYFTNSGQIGNSSIGILTQRMYFLLVSMIDSWKYRWIAGNSFIWYKWIYFYIICSFEDPGTTEAKFLLIYSCSYQICTKGRYYLSISALLFYAL